jgi:hypothetical protein
MRNPLPILLAVRLVNRAAPESALVGRRRIGGGQEKM